MNSPSCVHGGPAPVAGQYFEWYPKTLDILRAIVTILLAGMTRILLRSRQLMAVGVLLLLAGVAVLSAATRKPCLEVRSGGWHTWKAGYMAEAKGQALCAPRVLPQAVTPQIWRGEIPRLPVPFESARAEPIPRLPSLVAQFRRFRSPPSLV